jgi:hypothetical protein
VSRNFDPICRHADNSTVGICVSAKNTSPPVSLLTTGTSDEHTSLTQQLHKDTTRNPPALTASTVVKAANSGDATRLKTKASGDESYQTNIAMKRHEDNADMAAVITARTLGQPAHLDTTASQEVNIQPMQVQVKCDEEAESVQATMAGKWLAHGYS